MFRYIYVFFIIKHCAAYYYYLFPRTKLITRRVIDYEVKNVRHGSQHNKPYYRQNEDILCHRKKKIFYI